MNLHWPACLSMDESERQATQLLMAEPAADSQRAMLGEAAGRMRGGSVRNRRGFRRGLIKRAIGGEFVANGYAQAHAKRRVGRAPQGASAAAERPAARSVPPSSPRTAEPSIAEPNTTSPEEAQAAREQCLRSLGLWPSAGKNPLSGH